MEMELERAIIARISSLAYWQGRSRKASRIEFGLWPIPNRPIPNCQYPKLYRSASCLVDSVWYWPLVKLNMILQYCTPILPITLNRCAYCK